MQKRICAITMVRGSEFFLRKWVEWYGSQLGKENLWIFFDGLDQTPPGFTAGCNVTAVPRIEGTVSKSDRGRIALLSAKADELLDSYDFVLGTDVDEFIVPDPSLGVSLPEYLSGLNTEGRICFSPLGCDVVQRIGDESELDRSRPVLSQRSFAMLSTRYTKASILCGRGAWGSGFHRVRGSNFHILKGLYLFHFGCVDAADVLARIADEDLGSRGWSRHLGKRYRLLGTVSKLPVRDFRRATAFARCMQTVCRPPWAWNKPSMAGIRILVRIPERFKGLI